MSDNGIYPAWVSLLKKILAEGKLAGPRGKRTRELLGARLHVPWANYNVIVDHRRKLNYRFMVAEWLWIECGLNAVAPLARYNRRLAEFSDNGETLAGAYGPRLHPQRGWLLQKFAEDPETRQAVATIWTPRPAPSKDIPCTISLQFLLRRGRLHLVANMRSSDAWLGVPYDFFSFTQYANRLAADLDAELGSATLNFGSSHLYEEHWEDARRVVEAAAGTSLRSPRLRTPFLLEDLEKCLFGIHVVAEPTLCDPWQTYRECLEVKTSQEALIKLWRLDA